MPTHYIYYAHARIRSALDFLSAALYIADRYINTKNVTIMANEVTVNPRYMKYNKDEVEDILDGAIQLEENDNPMSLVTAE